MSTYSVAEAKNRLPELIDRALKGEEVVITRRPAKALDLGAGTRYEGRRLVVHAPVAQLDRAAAF